MKNSLFVCMMFCAGCMLGVMWKPDIDFHPLSMCVLYALMLQVGVSIGSHKDLKQLFAGLRPKMLFIPLATVVGTLAFSACATGTPLTAWRSAAVLPITHFRPFSSRSSKRHRSACSWPPNWAQSHC